MSQYNTGANPDVAIVSSMNAPADRVRWGAIIGGLFTSIATLVLLSVLGMAIGLSVVDVGDRPGEGFAWGAAIWAVLTAIIAFFLGGWIAGRTAAFQGHRSGLLNGAMVWATSIALTVLLLGTSATSLLGSGAQAVGNVASRQDAQAAGRNLMDQARTAAAGAGMDQANQQQPQGADRQTLERADRAATTSAWSTLVALVIGLAAAATGGYVGSQGVDEHDLGIRDRDRDRPRAATP